jgi:hypothetical protein
MALSFILTALFGKAAVGTVAKGVAAKAGVKAGIVGAKGLVGHHGHHKIARHVAQKVAEEIVESGVRAALSKKRKTDEKA